MQQVTFDDEKIALPIHTTMHTYTTLPADGEEPRDQPHAEQPRDPQANYGDRQEPLHAAGAHEEPGQGHVQLGINPRYSTQPADLTH